MEFFLLLRKWEGADSNTRAWAENTASTESKRSLKRKPFLSDVVAETKRMKVNSMSKHVSISASEAADRLAIRELVEAYAHCADRRDANGQMALFTTNA